MNRPVMIGILTGCIISIYGISLYHTHQVTRQMIGRLTATEEAARAQKTAQAAEQTEQLQLFWEEKEKVLMLYIRHNELDQVANNLAQMAGLIESGDSAAFYAKLDQTEFLVQHIFESELPLWKNIL